MGETRPPCRPGDRIGKYTVLSLLGRAAMGDAYLASLPAIGRQVVMAILGPVGPDLDRAMRREAAFIARLHHPNIPRLYDVGEHHGCPYVVFEYVEGRDLAQLIAAGEQISVLVALRIMAALAGALQHAHENGVLHRDLNPRDIVIGPSGEPVLCGFWFSAPSVVDPSVTGAVVLETLAYSSPEQARQSLPTPQSDVWRLGATMFHALTGDLPVPAGSQWEIVKQLTSPRELDMSCLEVKVPEYVAAIVSRCLRKEAEERYRSAAELRSALEAAIDHMEMVESDTVDVAPPRLGQTILLHVECREPGMTGAFREYEIGTRLGGGTFGVVYRAIEKLSGKTVALKILKREWLDNAEVVARFRREATLLSRLSHPNIVRLHNFARYGRSFLMAMDLLEGPMLEDVIKERAPLDVGTSLSLMIPVLEGLSAVHDAGAVHRDLKPSNVKVIGETPVVFDFGIAHVEDMTKLTMPGWVVGTPDYMAPEQAVCESVSSASDVYSAGVILYEMMTVRLPYEDESPDGLVRKIATVPPVPITERRSDLPDSLPPIISMMLARDPDARPSAAEAGKLLREVPA